MRRLFSEFSNGLPGLGLLLLRVIAGVVMIVLCARLSDGASLQTIMPQMIAAVGGLFLIAGLWTPVAGGVVAIIELWVVFSHGHDPWVGVLLTGLGAALALLGPGGWSVDARRSGWKRIEIRRPEQ